MEEVAADAAAARHLADVGTKLDANRKAINALGEQTRAQFDQVNKRFEQVDKRFERLEAKVDAGFAQMRHGFDQTAAGFARIATLIEGLEARGAGG